ncbi:MAG: AraC family transcriptional regulator [Gaiellales bacterium]
MRDQMTIASLPLASHQSFHSTDLDETREHVARVFCDHRLALAGGERTLDARQHVARLGDVTVSYLDYGAAVEITPGTLDTFFLIQIPLRGQATIRCGHDEIASAPSLASVPDPDAALTMSWSAACPHLIVRFERWWLEDRLAATLGRHPTARLRFELGLDLTGAAVTWRQALEAAILEADSGSPLGRRAVADELATLLLQTHRSNYSAALRSGGQLPGPAAIRRAVAFAEEHAATPIGVAELAAAAGVSIRSLQLGFRKTTGAGPASFLRALRLDRVRRELVEGELTVTEAATRWGFSHLGRFSAEYRDRFGELPSATLRGDGASCRLRTRSGRR